MGDPGIEPGVRLREGVTVPCHTLRPVAHRAFVWAVALERGGLITSRSKGRQQEKFLESARGEGMWGAAEKGASDGKETEVGG